MTHPADALRVAIVVDSAEYGGAESYVARLVSHLPNDIVATLITTLPMPAPLVAAADAAGVDVVAVDQVGGKRDIRALISLGRAMRGTSPHVVHLNMTIPTNNRHAMALAAALRLPSVATLHLVAPVSEGRHGRLMRALFSRPCQIIAVSDEIRQFTEDRLGVSGHRVVVVPNGVDMPEAVAVGERATIRVGSLGRLTTQKGYDVLVEATRRLVTDGVPVDVRIAGDGPERPSLETAAEGLPVRFLGFLPDSGTFLRDLDIFCLPSRWEGLPFALLEAMAIGLPCVASAVGDIPTALEGVGLITPPGDVDAVASALRELATSVDRRQTLGVKARLRVLERFSVERMTEATIAIYRDCR